MLAAALARVPDADVRPAPRRLHPPILMGDIVTARAGVPELLIQAARAEGRDDPPATS